MTLQTLVVLAHSVNVALSSPRLMDAFRFQVVRRHWTLGIRSPKPESQAYVALDLGKSHQLSESASSYVDEYRESGEMCHRRP